MGLKVGCVCPTYKRPELLGRAIYCFLQQSWEDAYLVVLDDAGQYEPQTHERWCLVSTDKRYNSLGGKRQAGIEMLPDDCDGYLCWDDDDVYWPHAVAAVAETLSRSSWAQCRLVYETVQRDIPTVGRVPAFGREPSGGDPAYWGYGGSWAYRLDSLREVGGYDDDPQRSNTDDYDLGRKFLARYGPSADSTAKAEPWYWYNRTPGVNHVNDEGADFWAIRGKFPLSGVRRPRIGWNGPNLYEWNVLADIQPRPF